jgi:undecaprenyl-diphosphatase
MVNAIFWGIIQGLTEFLPISSSGHLVVVPALFDRPGPDLATSAVLHLGTLAAVLVYFRKDVGAMAKFDRPARKLISLIVIGSIPAVVLGLTFESHIERLVAEPRTVSVMLIVTGIVLLGTTLLRLGDRTTEEIGVKDSVWIGFAQSLALIPGISRSGMTISMGLARGMERTESARFAFLLGIPVIAGAGLLEAVAAISEGGTISAEVLVGVAAAGLAGYAAIAVLLKLLAKVGLAPFGLYCILMGTLCLIVL